MKVDTDIKLESVILSDENKAKVKLFLNEIENRDKLLKYGLTPLNRLLFYGASGTGKTYLAKAIANRLNYKMLYVDIAKALSDDSVAQNMAEIFEEAEETQNCIIFLDECDSITLSRYSSDYGDSSQVRRATNSLFQQLDKFSPNNLFIAATNLLFKIDPAFERRMQIKLEFKRPELNIKDAIQHFIFPSFEIIDDVDKTTEEIISRRASQYAKLSYYEIQGLVERAMKRAVLNDTNKVSTADIYKDLATAMRVKINFKTQDDPPEIFENKHYY